MAGAASMSLSYKLSFSDLLSQTLWGISLATKWAISKYQKSRVFPIISWPSIIINTWCWGNSHLGILFSRPFFLVASLLVLYLARAISCSKLDRACSCALGSYIGTPNEASLYFSLSLYSTSPLGLNGTSLECCFMLLNIFNLFCKRSFGPANKMSAGDIVC